MLIADCAHVVVPEASALAMQYYRSGNILWTLGQCLALGIPLLFFIQRFSAKLSAWCSHQGKKWFFAISLYLTIFTCLYHLLMLPFDFYVEYIRQHAYQLSNQPLTQWFKDDVKSFFITLVGVLAFAWIFYLFLKKSPKRWWIYGSLVNIAITFFSLLIEPIWIDPLFNQFTPMQDKRLEKEILQLASRAGIEGGRVFEVNKSQETNMLNAYVTGFGKTGRIVLWDTTINRLSKEELLFVMGHEMGHYVLHHLWWYMLYFSISSFVIFYLLYLLSHFLLRRYPKFWGFKHLYNIASLPLLIFLLSLLTLLSLPFFNLMSRHLEHEADRFGLELTRNNQAAGEAFIVLQEENLANPRPGPIYKIWRSSHPPLAERVEFANTYCPWKNHQELRYQRYFLPTQGTSGP